MTALTGMMEGPSDGVDRDERHSSARISSQLTYMAENLNDLRQQVHELEERITPILLPELLQGEKGDIAVPRKPSSPLSDQIDELNGNISRIQNLVREISARVQL